MTGYIYSLQECRKLCTSSSLPPSLAPSPTQPHNFPIPSRHNCFRVRTRPSIMVFQYFKQLLSRCKESSKYTLLPTSRTSTDTTHSAAEAAEDFNSSLEKANAQTLAAVRVSPRVISDATIGLSDGLTVPFALTAGLSALGDTKLVIYAGLAELIAGAISMGLGGYLGAVGEAYVLACGFLLCEWRELMDGLVRHIARRALRFVGR